MHKASDGCLMINTWHGSCNLNCMSKCAKQSISLGMLYLRTRFAFFEIGTTVSNTSIFPLIAMSTEFSTPIWVRVMVASGDAYEIVFRSRDSPL